MGWITDRRNQTGHGLARHSKTGRRAGILRKITGSMESNGMWYEQLECGHKGFLMSKVNEGGLFGVKDALARRCLECRREATNPSETT